jgi:hypothetical protein
VTVSTAAELDGLQEKHESFVLGSFKSLETEAAKAFIALATESEETVSANIYAGI